MNIEVLLYDRGKGRGGGVKVFKIYRQNICRFRVNERLILHICHRSQNVLASCERSLS